MEKQIYSYDEAYEESLRYFQGDELAARVWVNKYAVKDSFGKIYEKSPEDMHWRIANEVALSLIHILPKLVFPITTITVGYPDGTPAQVDRLPLEAAVHQEVYHDYTPEDIDRLYEYKESLPENKQFIEENQKENLAQVFTDVRYTKKDNEFMSETLLKELRQQGF